MTKMPLQFTRQGGYFCVLLLSLQKEYPIPKQVKPKLTTAIKSTILIWLSPPFLCFQKSGFYVIGGSQSLRSEGLTAYRDMVAPINNYNNKTLFYQCIAFIYLHDFFPNRYLSLFGNFVIHLFLARSVVADLQALEFPVLPAAIFFEVS